MNNHFTRTNDDRTPGKITTPFAPVPLPRATLTPVPIAPRPLLSSAAVPLERLDRRLVRLRRD